MYDTIDLKRKTVLTSKNVFIWELQRIATLDIQATEEPESCLKEQAFIEEKWPSQEGLLLSKKKSPLLQTEFPCIVASHWQICAFFLLGDKVAKTVWQPSIPVGSEICKEWWV